MGLLRPVARRRVEWAIGTAIILIKLGLPSLGIYEAIHRDAPDWLVLCFFIIL